MAVNPVTDQIYVTTNDYNMTGVDGAANATAIVGNNLIVAPNGLAVDSETNKAFAVSCCAVGTVTVVRNGSFQSIPLQASVTPLDGNQTTSAKPTLTLSALSGFSPIAPPLQGMYAQVDTWQKAWTAPTKKGSGNFRVTVGPLQPGFHILYVYATDGQVASATLSRPSSPLVGDSGVWLSRETIDRHTPLSIA